MMRTRTLILLCSLVLFLPSIGILIWLQDITSEKVIRSELESSLRNTVFRTQTRWNFSSVSQSLSWLNDEVTSLALLDNVERVFVAKQSYQVVNSNIPSDIGLDITSGAFNLPFELAEIEEMSLFDSNSEIRTKYVNDNEYLVVITPLIARGLKHSESNAMFLIYNYRNHHNTIRKQLLTNLGFAVIVFSIVQMLCVYACYRFLLGPLEQLTNQAIRGELGGQQKTSVREVAQLANAFGKSLSEVKDLHEDQKRSTQELNAVLNQVGMAIMVTDETGKLEFANESARSVLPSNAFGVSQPGNLVTAADYRKILHAARDAIRYETRTELSITYNAKDDDKRIMTVTVTPRVRENVPVGTILVFKDVTELDRLAREREEANQELASFIQQSNIPICAVSNFGEIDLWNRAFSVLLGVTDETFFKGKEFASVVSPESYSSVADAINNTENKGIVANLEAELMHGDLTRIPVKLDLAPKHKNAEVQGCWIVAQDLTEVRRAQAELMQAVKLEAIGKLTGGIAHDFNNLLTVIDGNLRFLIPDSDSESPERAELFYDACEALSAGKDMTRKLLDFSREDTVSAQVLCLNDEIEAFVNFVRRVLGDGIVVQYAPTQEELLVKVDKSSMKNALLNLCINSRDAMPEGGIIEITLSSSEGEAEISLRDTGEGIEEEIIERVFDPFFTTKSKGNGTGLGLLSVQSFAQQASGHCEMTSVAGRGTEVVISLPISGEKLPSSGGLSLQSDLEGEGLVLVVDDDDRVRRVTLRDLDRLGYETVEASSAEEAIQIIEQQSENIQLVISDVIMPGGLNGKELYKWCEIRYPLIPVILLSGYNFTGKDDDLEVIRKPYEVSELAAKVNELTL